LLPCKKKRKLWLLYTCLAYWFMMHFLSQS